MSNSELLQIEPLELQLKFVLRQQISCPMKLTNNSDNHVAFKLHIAYVDAVSNPFHILGKKITSKMFTGQVRSLVQSFGSSSGSVIMSSETTLISLPDDVLTLILVKVASVSVADLCNCKMSCMRFNRAADHNQVYRNASMSHFPPVGWVMLPVNQRAFSLRYLLADNPDLLYKIAVSEFFVHGAFEPAFALLERSMQLNLRLLYFFGDEITDEAAGMNSLIKLQRSGKIISQRQTLLRCMQQLFYHISH